MKGCFALILTPIIVALALVAVAIAVHYALEVVGSLWLALTSVVPANTAAVFFVVLVFCLTFTGKPVYNFLKDVFDDKED